MSKVLTSAEAQQWPLIQSSLNHYQTRLLRITLNIKPPITASPSFKITKARLCIKLYSLKDARFFVKIHALLPGELTKIAKNALSRNVGESHAKYLDLSLHSDPQPK